MGVVRHFTIRINIYLITNMYYEFRTYFFWTVIQKINILNQQSIIGFNF